MDEDERKEKDELLAQTMKMLVSEFRLASTALNTYIKSEPYETDSHYFRLRYMQKICEDLIEMMKTRQKLSSDIVNGAEMAIKIYERSRQL
jgi:hypothetical protein